MIVLDASALVELLVGSGPGSHWVRREVSRGEHDLHAPHLIDAEFLSAVRSLVGRGWLTTERAEEALTDLDELALRLYPHRPFLRRAFELRHDLSAYDALYVALAETLGAPLVTVDVALGAMPGHRVEVRRRIADDPSTSPAPPG